MAFLTKPQRKALKRVFDRHPIFNSDGTLMTYRAFRRTAIQGFDCLMVHWAGMWLGIEKDGYTHS